MNSASPGVAILEATARLDEARRALEAQLAIPGVDVDTVAFERAFELEHAVASALYLRTSAVLLGGDPLIAWPQARVADVSGRIAAVLTDFHRAQPEEIGIPALQLKGTLPRAISMKGFLALLRHLSERQTIEWRGPRIKLRGHVARFDAADRVLWERCLARLLDRGMHPFTARDVARDLGVSEAGISDLLSRRQSHGDVSRLDDARYLTTRQVAVLAATAAGVAAQAQGTGLTAAHFRDILGTGRNLTVQILEFLDGLGVTRRDGDIRTMIPDYEVLVGFAPTRMPAPATKMRHRVA